MASRTTRSSSRKGGSAAAVDGEISEADFGSQSRDPVSIINADDDSADESMEVVASSDRSGKGKKAEATVSNMPVPGLGSNHVVPFLT